MGVALYAGERRDSTIRIPFVDSLARAVTSDTTPGVAIFVARDGRVLHSAGYGIADLATRRSITAATPFYLASVSKQLTAMAVLRRVRDGALQLDDPVSRFVPGLDSATGRVTVRQLLTHSAGVPNYYGFLTDWSRLRRLDNGAVLDSLRGKPLDFSPGTRSKYSNSGYVLLATMLERATGRPFARLLSDDVFARVGMRDAMVLDDSAAFPAGRAVGYDSVGGRVRLSDYGSFETASGRRVHVDMRTVGAGGVYASLRDLAAWDAALTSGALLDPATQEEAFRAHVRADSAEAAGVDTLVGYGYGWIVSRRYGTDVVWHDGALAGFRNIVLRVPSRRVSVIVLSNAAWIDQRRLAVAIADRLLVSEAR
jgi:CubicO group peptidase (beta-lactamase class C family)